MLLFLISYIHSRKLTQENLFYINTNEDTCFYDQTYTNQQTSYSNLCFYRCKFESIYLLSQGSAVYIYSSDLNAIESVFEDCIFNNCTSRIGGSIYITSTTSAVIKMNKCTFTNNAATSLGGAIYLSNSNFQIDGCHFLNNEVNYISQNVCGGALCVSTSEGCIQNCDIKYNTALVSTEINIYVSSYGGSIYFLKTNTNFSNCNFISNIAHTNKTDGKKESGMLHSYGGAITMTTCICNFFNCSFINNIGTGSVAFISAPCDGGAIYMNESSIVDFKRCEFTNNTVFEIGYYLDMFHTISGSALYIKNTNATICECNFKNNTSYANSSTSINSLSCEGCIVNTLSRTNFIRCNFIGNTAKIISTRGSYATCNSGAISSFDGDMNCTSCSFIDNKAYYTLRNDRVRGGAITFRGGNITNCCFKNNTAIMGGHIYYSQSRSYYLFVINCNFITLTDNDSYMKSLFYFNVYGNMSIPNQFINCKISFSNVNSSILLFDGVLGESCDEFFMECNASYFKFLSANNCISSYDDIVFRKQYLTISNPSCDLNYTIESMFEKKCDDSNVCNPVSFIDDEHQGAITNTIQHEIINTPQISNADKNGNNTKNKTKKNTKKIAKKIILITIFVFEVIIICILIVFIVLIAKRCKHSQETELLINDVD